MFGKGKTRDTTEATKQHRHKTALDWMPVDDIHDGVIYRRDGYCVAVVQVTPINLSLLSAREQEQKVSALHEAINGLRGGFQLLVLPQPIDLDGYIRGLEQQMSETSGVRRKLLSDQLAYVRSIVGSGQATEWRYYMLVASRDTQDAAEQAHELAHGLTEAGLAATVMDDTGLIGMMHTWAHPATAAFERPVPAAMTTLLEGVMT